MVRRVGLISHFVVVGSGARPARRAPSYGLAHREITQTAMTGDHYKAILAKRDTGVDRFGHFAGLTASLRLEEFI